MSTIALYGAKGGQGVTTAAAALAFEAFSPSKPGLLVGLAGDLAEVAGCRGGTGLADTAASGFPPSQLAGLVIPTSTPGIGFLPAGSGRWPDAEPPEALVGWLADNNAVVDIGAAVGDPTGDAAGRFRKGILARAECRVLVARDCFTALKRSVGLDPRPDGILLLTSHGSSVGAEEYQRAVGAPVLASAPLDPAVHRAVDEATLHCELPQSLRSAVGELLGRIEGDGDRTALLARRGAARGPAA